MYRVVLGGTLVVLLIAGCIGEPTSSGASGAPEQAQPPNVVKGKPVFALDALKQAIDPTIYGGELPSFDLLVASTRISGEPTIAVTRTHAVFYPAIDFDGPNGLPLTLFMRSTDDGASWVDKSPAIGGAVRTHPYSFDPYVYADPTTGRVFALDMGPYVNCNMVSWSDDDGETWLTQFFTCPVPVVDHPSIFAGPAITPLAGPYPNVVYLCTNGLQIAHCALSLDGGAVWLESTPVFQECGGLTGHGHASWADGTVYLPRVGCGVPQVGVSRDGGLTWEVVDVTHAVSGNGHEAILSTDTDGTAYIVWVGENSTAMFLSVSKDQGRTWSAPLDVTAPGVTAAKLPSIVAGSAGRVAFLYVGTTTPSGLAVAETDDNGDLLHPEEYLNATWNVYIGMSLTANQDNPIFVTTTPHALDSPVKRGGCSGRCFGNVGGMYDFLDIDIDPIDGRVWAALVDVCTEECDEPSANAEARQQSYGVVARQMGGTMLLVEPLPEA